MINFLNGKVYQFETLLGNDFSMYVRPDDGMVVGELDNDGWTVEVDHSEAYEFRYEDQVICEFTYKQLKFFIEQLLMLQKMIDTNILTDKK